MKKAFYCRKKGSHNAERRISLLQKKKFFIPETEALYCRKKKPPYPSDKLSALQRQALYCREAKV